MTFKIHNQTFKIHNFVCVVYLGLVVTKKNCIFAAEYVTIGLLHLTNYMLTEIWIRPTITYGLVACFVTEVEKG